MTPHSDEHTLEMLILEPARLRAPESAAIYAHLAGCAGCRAVHEELRAVHMQLRANKEIDPARLDTAMQAIFTTASVIRLAPYHPQVQVPAGGGYSGILAAMAPDSTSEKGFETVATFASTVDRILLRVRQDAASRRVKLYYHADDPQCQLGPVVTLPALDADAVIDDRGRAEFHIEEPRTPREWSQLEALVAFPVCTVVRTEDGPVRVENTPGHTYNASIDAYGTQITIHCAGGPGVPEVRRAVVWSEDAKPVLVQLSSGQGSFIYPATGRNLVIRLYT